VFLAVQIFTPFFFLTVPNFVVFFRLLNRKFNENFKNELKTVIFSLQVGLQVILSLTILSNCVSASSSFDFAFLPDYTIFFSVSLGYWIENLMAIQKMCLK